MANFNDVNTIIVPASSANLTAHTYTEVYGGSAGCVMTINGVIVNIGPSSNLSVVISSVSGGTGCYLLGEKINVFQGSDGLGGIN